MFVSAPRRPAGVRAWEACVRGVRVLSSQMIAIELPNHTMQQHATRTPKPSRVLPPLCAMRWFCAWARHCASLGVQTAHIDMQKDRQGSTKPVVAKAHAGPTVQDHPRGLGDGQHHPATARPWTTSSRRQRGASSFALRVSVAYRLSGKSLKLAELLHALLSDGRPDERRGKQPRPPPRHRPSSAALRPSSAERHIHPRDRAPTSLPSLYALPSLAGTGQRLHAPLGSAVPPVGRECAAGSCDERRVLALQI